MRRPSVVPVSTWPASSRPSRRRWATSLCSATACGRRTALEAVATRGSIGRPNPKLRIGQWSPHLSVFAKRTAGDPPRASLAPEKPARSAPRSRISELSRAWACRTDCTALRVGSLVWASREKEQRPGAPKSAGPELMRGLHDSVHPVGHGVLRVQPLSTVTHDHLHSKGHPRLHGSDCVPGPRLLPRSRRPGSTTPHAPEGSARTEAPKRFDGPDCDPRRGIRSRTSRAGKCGRIPLPGCSRTMCDARGRVCAGRGAWLGAPRGANRRSEASERGRAGRHRATRTGERRGARRSSAERSDPALVADRHRSGRPRRVHS